ncbi:MAG: hypothetical protein C0407_16870, partial [Desulfobacca sp.]|nr:hypothetical protein [Desulfobacca sp.]
MLLTSFHPEIRISGWKHLDIRSVDFVDLKLRSPFGDRLGRRARAARLRRAFEKAPGSGAEPFDFVELKEGIHSDALCRASEKAPVRVPYVDLKLRSPFGDRIKLSPETLF